MTRNDITITLPREQWRALVEAVPVTDMTYTPSGEALGHAWSAIQDALQRGREPSAGGERS